MKMENITKDGKIGWMDQISPPAMAQDCQQRAQADNTDDASDDPIMFVPTPQPVWPRVWPGL
jgi:hypothetical protein